LKKLLLFLLLLSAVLFANNNYITFQTTLGVISSTLDPNYVSKGSQTNPAEKVFYLQDALESPFRIDFHFEFSDMVLHLEIPLDHEYQERLRFNGPYLLFKLVKFDGTYPRKAYFKYENESLGFSFGKYPLSWGPAYYPLTIAPNTNYNNFTFFAKFPFARYYFHLIGSDSRDLSEVKHIIGHRLEFNFGDFEMSLGEINIIGGRYPDFIDINPLMVYHNNYRGNSNVIGSLDLTYKTPYADFYFEFSMDDFVLPEESGNPETKPFSYGLGYGAKFKLPIGEFIIEKTSTSEWMYITYDQHYMTHSVRQYYPSKTVSRLVDYPLGFLYGPDADMFSIIFKGEVFGIDALVEYNYLTKATVVEDGTTRWKWFWDGFPLKDQLVYGDRAGYNLLTFNLSKEPFRVYFKTIDFQDYILGLFFKYDTILFK